MVARFRGRRQRDARAHEWRTHADRLVRARAEARREVHEPPHRGRRAGGRLQLRSRPCFLPGEMTMIRALLLAVALAAGNAQGQNASQAELLFWESVRDSKNPAELQAYLQTFPNGVFAPIARARL